MLEIPKEVRPSRVSESGSHINRLVDKSQLKEEGTQFFVTLSRKYLLFSRSVTSDSL